MPSPTSHAADNPLSIIAAIALGTVSVAAFNVQPMYLGALADHLGFDAQSLGLLAGIEVAGTAVAGVVALYWVKRWNWRRVAQIALTTMIVGNILSALVSDFVVLAGIRFVTGVVGMGSGYALSIAALSDTRNVDANFSYAVVAMVAIGALGFLVLPGYIGVWGPRAIFYPLALIALITLPTTRFLPTTSRKVNATQTGQNPTANRLVWLAVACQCIWYVGLGGFWAFIERLATNAGIAAGGIGQALAIGLAIGLAGAIAAAAVADKFGRILPFTIAMFGQIAALTLLIDLNSLTWLIVAICVYNTAWNFALPYIFAIAAVADTSGRLVVLMSTAQAVGLTIGAVVAGAMVSRYGLSAILIQAAALALASLAIYWVITRYLHNPNKTPID